MSLFTPTDACFFGWVTTLVLVPGASAESWSSSKVAARSDRCTGPPVASLRSAAANLGSKSANMVFFLPRKDGVFIH